MKSEMSYAFILTNTIIYIIVFKLLIFFQWPWIKPHLISLSHAHS